MIFALGGILESIDKAQLTEERSAVFLADSPHMREAMELAGIVYEGEISLSDVGFCKLEAQQECLAGSFCIPQFLDVLGRRYRILFFINRKHIVIIDDADFSARLILRIRRRMVRQGQTRENFLYNFITQFMNRDLEMLGQYERRIMELEEEVTGGRTQGFQSKIVPIRRELLTLRGYYDEMMDLGKQLEENENGFFSKK